MRRVPVLVWSGVAVLLITVAAIGTVVIRGRMAEPPSYTLGEMEEMYPIPPGSESAWMLDYLDQSDAKHRNRTDERAVEAMAFNKTFRGHAATRLQALSKSQRLFAKFYATRIPQYAIADIMRKSPNVIDAVGFNWDLYRPEIVAPKIIEYIDSLGGDAAFVAKHPDHKTLPERARRVK